MSDGNNAEALRAWFRTCPVLASGVRFNADFTAGRSTEYAIFSVPSALQYRENILGEEVLKDDQTQNFLFVAELPYGEDAQVNLASLGFMQAVADWVLIQNAERNFPAWDGGTIKAVVPSISPGAPVRASAATAKYQLQIKINYRRI